MQVLTISIARLLFFPAFVLCTLVGPRALHTEVPVFLLTLALGVTSGAYCTLALMNTPLAVHMRDAEQAMSIIIFFVVFGCTLGSFLGWLWLL